MSEIFHVDFYAKDWLLDTQVLTLEERGVFITIVSSIYHRGEPILNDNKWLSNLCNCSSRKVRSILDALVQKRFVYIEDGYIHQKRALAEIERAQDRRVRASKNAQKKHQKDMKTSSKHGEKPSKTTRKQDENAAKTPRKSAEKEPEFNKNNDLSSATYQTPDNNNKKNIQKNDLDRFQEFWDSYPKQTGLGAAERAFQGEVMFEGADVDQIIMAAKAYSRKRSGEDQTFTQKPSNFLIDKTYLDPELNLPPPKAVAPIEFEFDWQRQLASDIGDTPYRTWFQGAKLNAQSNRHLTFEVENTFLAEKMRQNFEPNCFRVLRSFYPEVKTIEFKAHQA